jgi:hypothetical protein
MVEKDALFKSKARHVGIFDFKETYRVLFEWLYNEGYDVNEILYKEVVQQGGTKEVDVFWEATKKISDYFKFFIKVRFHPVQMTSVEVEIEGVKQKMNKGDFTIEFECVLLKDYDSKWETSSFIRSLRRNYDKYLQRGRIEQHEGRLIEEMQNLVEYAKAFLALTGRR